MIDKDDSGYEHDDIQDLPHRQSKDNESQLSIGFPEKFYEEPDE